MADELKVINGYFQSFPIAIERAGLTGGVKNSVKQYPNKNTQSVEYLGLVPRKYQLDIIISSFLENNYFNYRDRLLEVLENGKTGILIHPLYGSVENVIAVSYSINENFGSFGDTVVSVDFEINENTGVPTTSDSVITQIASLGSNVDQQAKRNIQNKFGVTGSFLGSFSGAVAKVNALIEQVKKSTEFIGEAATELNIFSNELGELSANVNSLVSDPIALSDALGSLFDNISGLYASSEATLETFAGLFGFGDDDALLTLDTAPKIERTNNNNAINASVAASSLSYGYLAAVDIEYETVRDVDAVLAALDDQYTRVVESEAEQELKDSITDMRILVLESLNELRLNASQIITVETNETSSRLLSFAYYGSDENAQTINNLNKISDVSFVSGLVEVVTK